jgi:hypothetical protein
MQLFGARGAHADDARTVCVNAAEEGQTLLRTGRPLAAQRPLLTCSQASCPGVVRRDCVTFLSDAQAATPSVVIGVRDAQGHDLTDARVFLDGAPLEGALRGQTNDVEVGPHTLRFERAGSDRVEQTFVAREREKGRSIVAQFAPADVAARLPATEQPPVPPLAIVLGGVGLAATGLFAGFGARGVSLRSSSACDASHGCAASTYRQIQTSFDVADVSLAVAVLALAGATWIYLTTPRPRAPTLKVDAAAHVVSLRVGTTF